MIETAITAISVATLFVAVAILAMLAFNRRR